MAGSCKKIIKYKEASGMSDFLPVYVHVCGGGGGGGASSTRQEEGGRGPKRLEDPWCS